MLYFFKLLFCFKHFIIFIITIIFRGTYIIFWSDSCQSNHMFLTFIYKFPSDDLDRNNFKNSGNILSAIAIRTMRQTYIYNFAIQSSLASKDISNLSISNNPEETLQTLLQPEKFRIWCNLHAEDVIAAYFTRT